MQDLITSAKRVVDAHTYPALLCSADGELLHQNKLCKKTDCPFNKKSCLNIILSKSHARAAIENGDLCYPLVIDLPVYADLAAYFTPFGDKLCLVVLRPLPYQRILELNYDQASSVSARVDAVVGDLAQSAYIYFTLLQNYIAPQNDPEATETANTISRRLRVLMHHGTEFSLLAKLRSNQVEPKYAKVRLDNFLSSLVQACADTMSLHNIVLKEKNDFPKISALIDPNLTMFILLSLLDNSALYSGENSYGHKQIFVSAHASDTEFVIQVSDMGKGLTKEKLNEVMTPFYSRSPVTPGLGLGLPLSAELAQLLGGSLTLSSAPNAGVCACLTLPLKHCPESQSSEMLFSPKSITSQNFNAVSIHLANLFH